MKAYLSIVFVFLWSQSVIAQENITREEAHQFLSQFLQVIQYEQGQERKQKIASFLTPEIQELYLEKRYPLLSYATFKLDSLVPPFATVLGTKEVGRIWKFELTIELEKKDSQLYIKCKIHENKRSFNHLTFWQTKEEIRVDFSDPDVDTIRKNAKAYVLQKEPLTIDWDTSQLLNTWKLDSAFIHDPYTPDGEYRETIVTFLG